MVVALEHRDGSGPRTYINLPQQGENKATGEVDVKCEDRKRGFSRMDYVFPKDNAKDTMPGNPNGVDGELRSAQIQLRLAEIEEAYHVMTLIHDGKGEEVASSNLRVKKENYMGGSSRGLKGVNWSAWKNRFHLRQVTMLGHSFGAATTVEVLRHKHRFTYIGQGIIYDIWGAAIQPPEDNPDHRIHTPLLGINSEAFMYWPDNFSSLMKICKEVKDQNQLCWLMTVRGSIHISQSDFSILYPKICSLVLKMTVNPRRAIDLNINASLEFLKHVMPDRMSQMNRGTNEHLLEISALEKLPEIHQPSEKWLAVRLKIPHEFRIRLTPQWLRRYVVRKKKREIEKGEFPKDYNGKVLLGLEDLGPGEEVWMHVAPTKEELKRHGLECEVVVQGTERDEHVGGSGMVEVEGKRDGTEGQNREENKEENRGVEQKYMERG